MITILMLKPIYIITQGTPPPYGGPSHSLPFGR